MELIPILVVLNLTAYAVWFVFINKLRLESSLMCLFTSINKYRIRNSGDVLEAVLIHVVLAPVLIIMAAVIWPITLLSVIAYFLYKKKYLNTRDEDE